MPTQPRELAQIHADVRSAIRGCVAGETAWPLVFFGPAGTGKTSAALCLLDYAGGRYWTAPDLCEDFRNADLGRLEVGTEPGHSFKVSVAWLWKQVGSAALVVLDELGCREKVSDHHYETVKRLIDKRQGKPLVAVSNLGPEALTRVYDDRITDRLWAGTPVEFSGQSRRLAT